MWLNYIGFKKERKKTIFKSCPKKYNKKYIIWYILYNYQKKKKKRRGTPYGTFNVLGGMIFFMKSLRNVT